MAWAPPLMFLKSPRVDIEARCEALSGSALGKKVSRAPVEKTGDGLSALKSALVFMT